MKIVHVLGPLVFGGVESSALNLIRNIPTHEHVVICLTPSEAGPRLSEFQRVCEVVPCRHRPGSNVSLTWNLVKRLNEVAPDRLLAYSFGAHFFVALATWVARSAPMHVRVGGSTTRSPVTQFKSAVLAHLARAFCQGEIAISHAVADELTRVLRLPHKRVHVIPTGCDVADFSKRAMASRRIEPGRTNPRLIMISRMDDAKDQESLIRAVAHLRDQEQHVSLWLVGDGSNRRQLEKVSTELHLNKHVTFLGDRGDVPELLGKCDLLVHSTFSEGFGLVLAEAMAAQVPVVATDVPACREVLDNGRVGRLVPVGDSRALATEITYLLRNPAEVESLVALAWDRVKTLYDVSVTSQKYEALLTR